ncbi:Sir2 family NAD+-dependent deacetylase [Pantoea ananatis]
MRTPRRRLRLARLKKTRRKVHQRFRQRIFERDRQAELAAHPLPRIVVLTGAGISAESGINTFRAADGLWEEHRVEDVATPEGFRRDPALVQRFYNARRQQLQQPEIQPNAAHLALAELEQVLGDNFLLVTQNIDNLHERAGNSRVLHMHGELLKVRCANSGQVIDWHEDVTAEDRCTCCQFPSVLRPHVVWFGEMPLGMEEIYRRWSRRICLSPLAPRAMFIRPPDSSMRQNCRGRIRVELNLEPSQVGNEFAESHYGLASEVVPAFVHKLLHALHK